MVEFSKICCPGLFASQFCLRFKSDVFLKPVSMYKDGFVHIEFQVSTKELLNQVWRLFFCELANLQQRLSELLVLTWNDQSYCQKDCEQSDELRSKADSFYLFASRTRSHAAKKAWRFSTLWKILAQDLVELQIRIWMIWIHQTNIYLRCWVANLQFFFGNKRGAKIWI